MTTDHTPATPGELWAMRPPRRRVPGAHYFDPLGDPQDAPTIVVGDIMAEHQRLTPDPGRHTTLTGPTFTGIQPVRTIPCHTSTTTQEV